MLHGAPTNTGERVLVRDKGGSADPKIVWRPLLFLPCILWLVTVLSVSFFAHALRTGLCASQTCGINSQTSCGLRK